MAFEAAHDYIAQLVGAKRLGKVVRLQRTNPLGANKYRWLESHSFRHCTILWANPRFSATTPEVKLQRKQ